MPVKTVVCSICGQTVNHRQTLHLGDGKRACRSHSETQNAAEDMRAGEKFAKEKEKEKWNKSTWRREDHYPDDQPIEPLKPRCWLCHKQGLRQDDFFTRLLIEQKKYELVHGHCHNIFDPEEIRKSAGSLVVETCLWYVKWEGENTKISIPKRAFELIQMAGQMLGEKIFLVCNDCRQASGFKTITDERMENIDLSVFGKYANVFSACYEPVIAELAQKELEKVN